MSTTDLLQVGDVGFTFDATFTIDGQPFDVSGANLIELLLEKPDGTTHVRTGILGSNGLDGRVVYIVVAGDIDQFGEWRFQFTVAAPTWQRSTAPVYFTVGENIP